MEGVLALLILFAFVTTLLGIVILLGISVIIARAILGPKFPEEEVTNEIEEAEVEYCVLFIANPGFASVSIFRNDIYKSVDIYIYIYIYISNHFVKQNLFVFKNLFIL